MSEKLSMNDIIVLLPGIMGSVLEKDNVTLWSMPKIIGPAITSLTGALEALYLTGDDPEREFLDDGIRATQLMTGIHGIHGLELSEGYQDITAMIKEQFDVIEGAPDDQAPANFIPFPYDWRRDNRAAARRLSRIVKKKLDIWHAYRGSTRPRVILIGHSMGGLVARYYLEVLGGWEHCRALITFGTPHRGSLRALDSLCNGHALGLADLTELVRSFTSSYQLLPIYEAVHVGDTLRRAADLDGFPGLKRPRAAVALAFHREISKAVDTRTAGRQYTVIPIVGTHQSTPQSAVVAGGSIQLLDALPRQLPNAADATLLTDGDGTVPYISAIPIELSSEYRDTCHPEKHAWLPANSALLDKLCDLLNRLQVADFVTAFQGGVPEPEKAQAPALRVDLNELYQIGQPIDVRVQIVNQQADPGHVQLTVSGGPQPIAPLMLKRDGDVWVGVLQDVQPGVYVVAAETYSRQMAPPPVHSVFEVVPEEKAQQP